MPCDFRLEVFITLCRTGSFTRAADALGVSQPAVSQNIAELEKDLGVKLFSRSKGEVNLTSDGRLFRNHAERILYWYESARSAFRSGKDAPVRISVYCSPDLSYVILPELFSSLRHSLPGLVFASMSGVPDIRTVNDDNGNVLSLYSSVTGASHPGPSHKQGDGDLLLCSCSPVAAVSPRSRYLRDFTSVSLGTDYSAWPQIAVLSSVTSSAAPSPDASAPESCSSPGSAEEELALAGLSGKLVFISDSVEAVKHLAEIDPDVAAVLPPYCVQDELSHGRLAQLPSSWLDFRYSVFMRASEALRQLPVFEDIVRVLRELLQRDPHLSM
ncbi:MAG: LysR family transcriptional regulator [Bacteroidetes bacterium]|uniref:LysR family transcriptional regulator n=1 Tax=Candidatus Cryptobacteroides intestinigallinarum TaxID=2840767 RepID=A0A9D9HKL0_9BACT|nr:LysR family transcriptional regulator [Candidatus Cryptobacteroides intestinigallinarum]